MNCHQDLEEFTSIFIKVTNRVQLIEKARNTFKELDSDGDGYLQGEELRRMLDWALSSHRPDGKYHLSKEDKARHESDLLNVIITEKSGQMNIEEFAVLFDHLEKQKQMLRRQSVELAFLS